MLRLYCPGPRLPDSEMFPGIGALPEPATESRRHGLPPGLQRSRAYSKSLAMFT